MSQPPSETPPPATPTPSGTGQAAPSQVMDFGDAVVGIVVAPRTTLAYVCRERKIAWGVWLLVFFTVAGALVALVALPPELERLFPNLGRQFRVIYALLTLLLVPAIHLSTVLAYHIVARWFRGRGSFGGFFAGYMIAGVPGVLILLLQVLLAVVRQSGSIVAALAMSGVALWIAALDFFAIKANYNLTTGRAVAVYLIPWAAFFGLLLVGTVLIVIVALLALGGIG